MTQRKVNDEAIILSISKAARRMGITPDQLRYRIRISGKPIKQVAPPPSVKDKRCKYFDFNDLLSVVARQ